MRLMARTATRLPGRARLPRPARHRARRRAEGRLDLKRGGDHSAGQPGPLPRARQRRDDLADARPDRGRRERRRPRARADADALREAFDVITRLRFEHHAQLIAAGQPADNLIDPDELAPIARTELREALQTVRRAQKQRSAACARCPAVAPSATFAARNCARARHWSALATRSTLSRMCGIAGLYTQVRRRCARSSASTWRAMLEQLSDRGPDSAGVAFYRDPAPPASSQALAASPRRRARLGGAAATSWRGRSATPPSPRCAPPTRVFVVGADAEAVAGAGWREHHPELTLMSAGQTIEIYKEAGPPERLRRALRARRDRRQPRARATRGWRPRAASPPSTRTRSRPASTCAWSTTARSRTTTACAATLRARGDPLPDRQRHRGRGRLSDLAAARGRDARAGARGLPGRTSTASTPSPSAPPTASPCCATRSPASRRCMAETDDWVAMASEYRAIAVLPGAEDATHVGARAGRGLQLGHRAGAR